MISTVLNTLFQIVTMKQNISDNKNQLINDEKKCLLINGDKITIIIRLTLY